MVRLGGGGSTIGVPGGTNDEINQANAWLGVTNGTCCRQCKPHILQWAKGQRASMFSSHVFLLAITLRGWRHWQPYMWKHNPQGKVLLESDHSLIAKHQKARDWGESWWLQSWDHTYPWSQPLGGRGKRIAINSSKEVKLLTPSQEAKKEEARVP